MSLAPLTNRQIVRAHALLQLKKAGALDLTRSMNYCQCNESVDRLANAFIGFGLAQGERVAVLPCNRVEWEERVQAAVVRAPNSNIDDTMMIGWTNDRLAGYKRHREIVFLSDADMPRNVTGRILCRVLRKSLAQRLSTERASD